ncbi:Orm1 type endoplasmic reticulum protein [Ascoidea rubescens DSM 1968]|uniref:Orm1 type endoplasmic reticulum protein n=1 Tax=Ascoidea rubescens DSM 1968 TaxID=1344418 RepID=A0A1D2VR61_9ASCO|nr:Orm1 type endoplasmic reticulum protein [Ascoidea rubescens DSM 1968]ODV64091.1 Orm1 type endoplasmic reticulum protein [Ascoidea rubescens DSM 1968]
MTKQPIATTLHHSPASSISSIVNNNFSNKHRRRSSSIISHVDPETEDQIIDQNLFPNLNANWVNSKGAWCIHLVLIAFLKIFYTFAYLNNIANQLIWTLTNMTYIVGSYIMFHQVKGTPYDFNNGAYDNLTMWEQIDNGFLYTPNKKFLFLVPITIFLVSTHYANYNLNYFIINGVLCLIGIVPKFPFAHRLRIQLPL